MYACRAWVNFDGSQSSPAIRASGNVSSITKNGTGDYTVNFTTAMSDANYDTAVSQGVGYKPASGTDNDAIPQLGEHATASVKVYMISSGDTFLDRQFVSVAIFR
jgi:hypothetical protein